MRRLSFAFTIFLSALLLFGVQPLIARRILPWFGGTPATWTTCMLFFQSVLLGGYVYAHALSTRVRRAWQPIVHIGLLLTAAAFLPITPAEYWKPADSQWPVLRILMLLTATVGLPYFALATTGPLLQKWYSLSGRGQPYWLYALSNLGSLLALAVYPLWMERAMRLRTQAMVWSGGFAVFVVACAVCAWRVRRENGVGDRLSSPTSGATAATARPALGRMLLWLGLAAGGSFVLLAATNQMSQDVAVVPMLWVLPLGLYLLSFILVFQSRWLYLRTLCVPLFLGTGVLSLLALQKGVELDLRPQIAIYGAAVFACCMICHGELARARPDAEHLTLYYVIIAAGGAIGGLLVAVVAPLVLTRLIEFEIALAATAGLWVAAMLQDRQWSRSRGRPAVAWVLFGGATAALAMLVVGTALEVVGYQAVRKRLADDRVGWRLERQPMDALARSRNFYGTLMVTEQRWDQGSMRALTHGRILHGEQYVDGAFRDLPLSYYGRETAMGIVLRDHPRRGLVSGDSSLHIGAIGLGVGTVASYGRTGDRVRFYEINPEVPRLSRRYFTYLSDTPATVSIVMGDARLSLERELAQGRPQRFDVLIVDAFSGDAIPMHLLTREAMALYWKHIKDDGVIAVHVSNRYLELKPVVRSLCREQALRVFFAETSGNGSLGTRWASWVVATRNQALVDELSTTPGVVDYGKENVADIVWTDDYGSVLSVMQAAESSAGVGGS